MCPNVKLFIILFAVLLVVPFVSGAITFNEWRVSTIDTIWYCQDLTAGCVQRSGVTPDLLDDAIRVNDTIYFLTKGYTTASFTGVRLTIPTGLAADDIQGVWEYHKGRANNWEWLPFENVNDGTNNFTTTGDVNVTWDMPPSTDWNNYYLPASSNITNKYYQFYARFRVTSITNPTEGGTFTLASAQLRPYDIVISSGTEGTPTTFTDIYDADVAGGWGVVEKNGQGYIINANLYLAGNYYLSSKNEAITFGTNYQWYLAGIVKFGEIYSGDKVRYGSTFIFPIYDRSFYGTAGGNSGAGGSEWLNSNVKVVRLGGSTQGFGGSPGAAISPVYDCYFEWYRHMTFSNPYIGILGVTSMGAHIEGAGAIISDFTAFGSSVGWRMQGPASLDKTIHNSDFSKVTYAPMQPYYYNADNINRFCIDCYFGTWSYTDYAKWSSGSGTNNKIHIKASMLLRVVDEQGNAIEEATVTLKDKNSNIMFSYITNEDGYIGQDYGNITSIIASNLTDSSKSWSLQQWRFHEIYITSGSATGQRAFIPQQYNSPNTLPLVPDLVVVPSIEDRYIIVPYIDWLVIEPLTEETTSTVSSKYTDYNPMTLTIEANDYVTHNGTYNITSKTDWTIQLQDDYLWEVDGTIVIKEGALILRECGIPLIILLLLTTLFIQTFKENYKIKIIKKKKPINLNLK